MGRPFLFLMTYCEALSHSWKTGSGLQSKHPAAQGIIGRWETAGNGKVLVWKALKKGRKNEYHEVTAESGPVLDRVLLGEWETVEVSKGFDLSILF